MEVRKHWETWGNIGTDGKFPFRNHKQTDEILDPRRRKAEADVVSNPYSVRIDELGFQHGADFLTVTVALLAPRPPRD
jgi:hypothetical protein